MGQVKQSPKPAASVLDVRLIPPSTPSVRPQQSGRQVTSLPGEAKATTQSSRLQSSTVLQVGAGGSKTQ